MSFRKISILLIISLFISTSFTALSQPIISGTIHDAISGEALPYIALSLKKNLLSTVSNENGQFEFTVPATITDDTLVISSIGFEPQYLSVASINSPLNIKLKPNSFELKEVMILPMPPEHYIKMAMNSIKKNYPRQPFQTEAYYREIFTENDSIISFTEAVFNSYYPHYCDTSAKNSHQLLLYNKADDKKIAFMNKQNKAKKKRKKDKNETSVIDTSKTGPIDIKGAIGGPDAILGLDVVRGAEDYLDSTKFRYFEYSFAASSTYDNKELMVIDFKSRKRNDHVKKNGKIYIDLESNAIVSVDYSGDITLPTMIYPALFVLGVSVDRPTFHKKIDYVKVNKEWYPQRIKAGAEVTLLKKHLFRENEHSRIVVDGIFVVNKTLTENVKPIEEKKKYSNKKNMSEQVYNDDKITWNQINAIKR